MGLAKWTQSLDYKRKRWGESERDKERIKATGKKERKGRRRRNKDRPFLLLFSHCGGRWG